MSLRKKKKRTRNKMSMFSEQAFIVQESALILKELKEALWIGRSTRWEEMMMIMMIVMVMTMMVATVNKVGGKFVDSMIKM